MKICPNCHHHNAADSVFCANCGQRLPASTDPETNQETDHATAEPVNETRQSRAAARTPLSSPNAKQPRWLKWAIVAVVVLGLVVVGGFGYHQKFGKQAQVAAITAALAKGDRNALADQVVSDDAGLNVSAETLKPLTTYLKKHPQYASDAKVDLEGSGHTSDGTLRVVTTKRQFFLFPVYKVQVTTMKPKIETNVKHAEIVANGSRLTTTKYQHENYLAGPLMPGHYRFRLVGEYDRVTKTVDLMGADNVNQRVKLLVKTTAEEVADDEETDDSATADTDDDANSNTEADSAAERNDDSAADVDQDADDASDAEGDSDTDSTESTDSADDQAASAQDHPGTTADDLSNSAQTAVDQIEDSADVDPADYTYTESQPWTTVTEVKLYDIDSGHLAAIYRYDERYGVLAKYDQATKKFVAQ
ncbi:TcaA second domain-containing protein [Lactiplantibacillus modestisalitolerans]|uniref:Zinc-ribbon domain-containing protein n=1 Tax=Lactiplantibacillus modestisalitolerans TaxID=1457219 RepID=A0ABV5WUZ8_9LACO|nr:zinc-ribbon domain-containing protein [Lactiplantibacillus modestisalitolerans]